MVKCADLCLIHTSNSQYNTKYESVWNISAIDLAFADAHDLFLTPQCTAVITVFQPIQYDLSAMGMENDSWIMESYFQDIDLATNELMFEWRASEHTSVN